MSSTIANIREKLKRKLSMKEENPNLDDYDNADDVDAETTGTLSREVDKAEEEGYPQGKPGSFLNRMISHGNKKTEDQIAKEMQEQQQSEAARLKALSSENK